MEAIEAKEEAMTPSLKAQIEQLPRYYINREVVDGEGEQDLVLEPALFYADVLALVKAHEADALRLFAAALKQRFLSDEHWHEDDTEICEEIDTLLRERGVES